MHAFEPVPKTFAIIASACESLKVLDNVSLNRLGLSDHEESRLIYIPQEIHGKASLEKHYSVSWGGRLTETVRRLQLKRFD